MPFPLAALAAALAGLVVGSYLNVVVHRLPRGLSTISPRSACPACGAELRALDNVPVASYLWLRGRCRSCGARISVRYPLVELATAALFVGCVLTFGPRPQALAAAVFCALLLPLALIDLEHLLLPDKLTFPGMAAGLALQPWIDGVTLLDAVLGMLVGAGLLILLINAWYWLREEEGMGLGDVNLMALVGAFLGWKGVLLSLFAGALAGALVGLALLALRRAGLTSKLPFGAFLALGALAALFSRGRLVDAYLGLL
ncbi:MAG: prepilin peptidase [Acidobacteriota bacterium]|nr:prepilin peptidase [Acidobacteriota bacterium]MDH3521958.1 prepilin peptidase [Acidobacteriota bacterium]